MDFDVDERKVQLKNFQTFLTSTRSQISFIGQELGWSTEYASENEHELVECPENEEHRVPKERLDDHVKQCRWRKEGYDQDDVPLPEYPLSSDTHQKCIQIGKEEQMAVFREALFHNPSLNIKYVGQYDERSAPQTSNRWVADFTTDERRVLYDYVVSKTTQQTTVKLEDLTMSFQKEEKPKPKSLLEQLAEERDAKRRRVSQRSKKVHTNRKSQTEILREVILNQMELLEEWQKQVSGTNVEDSIDKHDESEDPKDSGGHDNHVGENSENEDLGREKKENLKNALVSYYRDNSPWRILEREGRNPYIIENWEKVCEKYARRNCSSEAFHPDDRSRENRPTSSRYNYKHDVAGTEKYGNREKVNRYSDCRHDRRHEETKYERKYHQGTYDREKEGESSKWNTKYYSKHDSRRDNYRSGVSRHHKRYYDGGDSDSSEFSEKQQNYSRSKQMFEATADETHTQYTSNSSDESHSHKRRRGSDVHDSELQVSYSRYREHRREKTEHNHNKKRRSDSAESSRKSSKSYHNRSQSPSKHKKKKKKKKKHKQRSYSSSSNS